MWRLCIRAKYIVKLEALCLHRILVSSPQFFLSNECIDVDRHVASGVRGRGVYLIHYHGHRVNGRSKVHVQRLDLVFIQVNTPNFLVFERSEEWSHSNAHFDLLGTDFG